MGGVTWGPLVYTLKQNKGVSLNLKQRKIFSHKETTLTQASWALYLLIRKCSRSKAHSCVTEWGFKDCAPETFFPNKQGYSRITTNVKKTLESFGLHNGNHTPPSLPLITSPLPRSLEETFTSAILTMITRWHLHFLQIIYIPQWKEIMFINRYKMFSSKQIMKQ